MSIDIYGKLNNETVKKEYSGGKSDTANVIVNNGTNTITAEVKKVPGKLTIDYYEDGELRDFVYDGSKDEEIHIPQVEDFNQLEADVERIDNQINGEEPESIVNQLAALNEKIEAIGPLTTTEVHDITEDIFFPSSILDE